MFDGRDVIYCFDGTFEGLMCCVFKSFERRELPCGVCAGEPEQLSLAEVLHVPTESEKAARVMRAVPQKICPEAAEDVKKAFLSCAEDRELLILKYLQMGFRHGARVRGQLADDTVNALNKAVLFCGNEAQKFREFIRFSDFGGRLVAVIEPKNRVLPLIAAHFIDRYRNESFLIYDRSHKMALVYSDYRAEILENIDFEPPAADPEEVRYRELWREFYRAVAIMERYNPRCRMNFMPKRYWAQMTEMCGEDVTQNSVTEKAYPKIENGG